MQVWGYGYGTRVFEKTGFRQKLKFRKKNNFLCKKLIFLSFGDTFTFPNSCAIQTNLGANELLKKTMLKNMGYWQNGLEIEKKVCDFKVPLGCLGLKRDNNFECARPPYYLKAHP